ncbi:MAG: prepilin peptidase [Polyangiales bacterium]
MLCADLSPWLLRLWAVLVGAAVGSFLNVAIHRWPLGMSVVTPGSHCPACGAKVRAWHNIPIFAYLWLRGRAACCGARLSPRYLLVESLMALLAWALVERYVVAAAPDVALAPQLLQAALYGGFVAVLLVCTFVDLQWMEIPDEASLPGTAVGLASFAWRPDIRAEDVATGAGLGFLLVQLIFVWFYERLTGRRGMGEGDAKLLMCIGAFLGWQGVVFALAAGSIQGILAVILAAFSGRPLHSTTQAQPTSSATANNTSPSDDAPAEAPDAASEQATQDMGPGGLKIPFGPFLALAALEFLFFGEPILTWYQRLTGLTTLTLRAWGIPIA